MKHRIEKIIVLVCVVAGAVVLAGCGNLAEQPKLHDPYAESPIYSENQVFDTAARIPLPESVPVGFERADEHLYNGTIDGEFADTFPFPITREVIMEGKQEFDSYCTPCHGYAGYGDGVLSEEGFPPPASYHDPDIRNKPVGSYFQSITDGQGAMYSYAARVTPEERWAVIAYIRTLQYSQNAPFDELPEELRSQIDRVEQ